MRRDDGGPADVLVVGGGPAGSTVGGLLALAGWDVTILDRSCFPRPKACGECINPGAVEALERLDLLDAVSALEPVELVGWDVVTGEGRTARGRFAPGVRPGLAVERSRLDAALLERARDRGVRVEEGVRVLSAEPGSAARPPSVSVLTPSGDRRRREARVVVGADGLRSVTARALGAPAGRAARPKLSLTLRLRGSGPPADRGRLVLTSAGTVGLAPVGPSLWNATVVVDAGTAGREVARDPTGFARSFVEDRVGDWSEPPSVAAGPWGSGNFDFRVERVAGGGILLVGDAAGYFDPLTGQGIFRALRSAELGALAIDTALRKGRVSERVMEAYAARLRSEFGPGRRIQRLVEAVVSRRSPRELAIGRLGSAPAAMDAFVRVTGDARPARSLLCPSVWGAALLPRSPARG